ncbi:MAG: PAS domain S-box protein, partial [Anaerolineales bacterium]|nr:PAS domain S-box protein [Anaerolineales bacterium]
MQEKAELFRQIFDRSPFGIGIATLDGRVVASNRTMQNITGYTAAELSKINLSDTYEKKEDRKVLFETLKRNDYVVDFPVRLKRKNGTPYDALLNISKIMLGDKEYVQTICQDIHERKKAEEGLRKRAEELSALQATIFDIISPHPLPELLHLIVERAAILLHASSGGLYFADPQKRQLRCVVSYNTARDFTGTVLAYGEGSAGHVAQTGKPLIINDYRNWSGRSKIFEDEQPFRVLISAPLLWMGNVSGVIHVLREDVSQKFTQEDLQLLVMFANHAAVVVENTRLLEAARNEILVRNNAEIAAHLKAEQYATMIATTTDGYWLVDSQGKVLDVNETYCRMSGYTRSELLSLSITDLEDA